MSEVPVMATFKVRGRAAKCNKSKRGGGQDVMVQLTNNSSILSKYSMSKLGYFPDEFLKYFVDRDARRSPLINRGYYVRAKAVDFIVKTFLSVAEKENSHCQIVSLGAGFDTLFFRLHSQGLLKHATVFEVDFPGVVKNKTCVILNNESLKASVGEIWNKDGSETAGLWADHYRLSGCDLKDLSKLAQLLIKSKIDVNQPTLLLSECVMTYMEHKDSSAVISWASSFFSKAVFITYEQIYPSDPFGQIMQKHFNNLNSPLLAINHFPDAQAQIDRYKSLGWSTAVYYDMNHFYNQILPKEERQRVEKLETFDEFEEWHLKCSHYIILGAFSKSFQHALFPDPQEVLKQASGHPSAALQIVCLSEDQNNACSFARFGHTLSWVQPNNELLMIGGFGERNGCHQRLSDAVFYSFKDRQLKENCRADIGERMFHTVTPLSDGSLLVYGGRKSPVKPCTPTLLLKMTWECVENIKYPSAAETNTEVCTKRGIYDRAACAREDASDVSTVVPTDGTCTEGMGNIYLKDGKNMFVVETLNTEMRSNMEEPPCRWRHTATRIRCSDELDKVFVFGGRNQTDSALGDCYLLSVKNGVWQKADLSEALQPRHSHCATLWKSRYIVLSGGVNKDSLPMSLLQIIDTQSQPMKVETLQLKMPLPERYSHSAHIISDHLVLIGGLSLHATEFPSLIIVDLNKLTFSIFELKPPEGVVLMLNKHSSCVMNSGNILITGGGGNCFSFGTHLNTEPFLLNVQDYLL